MTTSALAASTRAGHEPDRARTNGSVPVPTPPRARRRWGLFAAMVLVVALGVLGDVWLMTSTTSAQEVVAARTTIERGTVIAAEDLTTVRVELDPALKVIPGADLAGLVGQRAALDMAAGSLVTADAVAESVVPADGFSLVGIGVGSAQLPGVPLMAGDEIRVVATPVLTTATSDAEAPPVSVAAVVVGTQTGTAPSVAGQQTIVTVQVPTADAAALASLAATGNVAIVLDSRER